MKLNVFCLLAPFILFSCAGPSQDARVAAKKLKAKFSYDEDDHKSFYIDLWFMPIEAFELYIKGNDYERDFTVEAFNRLCEVRGENLPEQVVEKMSFVASHAGDEGLSACLTRVACAQRAPFAQMQAEGFNRLVKALLLEAKKRGLKISEKYVLNPKLDKHNLKSLFDYQFDLFYKYGFGEHFDKEMIGYVERMSADIKKANFEFDDLGPFYPKDEVDQLVGKVENFVEKIESLRPYLKKSCSLSGKKHVGGCKIMTKRFENFQQIKDALKQADRHLMAKRLSFIQGEGVEATLPVRLPANKRP